MTKVGTTQTARHDASAGFQTAASLDLNGSSDPEEKGIGEAQASLPPGTSWLSHEHACKTE
jgi:hypothetical protein